MLFDTRLSYFPQLWYIKVACLKAMDLLKVLAHTFLWRRPPDSSALALIPFSSQLENGCEIYCSATEARLHNAGVCFATGALGLCLISRLLVDGGNVPLHLRFHSLLPARCHQVQRLPDSVTCATVFED